MGTLSISNINIGRFGNKLLYLNNLFQVSEHFNLEPLWPAFDFDGIFKFSETRHNPKTIGEEFSCDFFLNNKEYAFGNDDYKMGPCMGNLFFEYDSLSTNKLFSFKEQYSQVENNGKKKVGIHFRGTDFQLWDPKSILPYKYYIESVKYILQDLKSPDEELEFFMCTDDLNMESFHKTLDFLKNEKQDVKTGLVNDMMHDFINLSYCDIIVSSPSTFSTAASLCGKRDKRIIQSKIWVDYQVANKDLFWIGVNNGGNNNYKIHKII